MIGRVIAVALIPLGPATSFAQSCPVLDGFVLDGDLRAVTGADVQCNVSRVLGEGLSEDCFWRFPFRSDMALRHFESLKREMQVCSDGQIRGEANTVNHPDTYDQVTADMNGISISLSLKDKGGLSETLVVLRRTLP